MATEKRAERKLELSVIVSRKIIFLFLSSMFFICRLRLATNCSILLTRLFHLSHHTVSLDIDAAEEPEPGAHANRELLGCKLNVE